MTVLSPAGSGNKSQPDFSGGIMRQRIVAPSGPYIYEVYTTDRKRSLRNRAINTSKQENIKPNKLKIDSKEPHVEMKCFNLSLHGQPLGRQTQQPCSKE